MSNEEYNELQLRIAERTEALAENERVHQLLQRDLEHLIQRLVHEHYEEGQ